MNRISLIAVVVGVLLGVRAAAQELPAPPKPPKSKAKAAEAVPEKSAPEKGADKSPSDAGPSAEDKGERDHRHFEGEVLRPRRLRINAPFFHMDLDFGGRGRAHETVPEREAVPAPRADEIPTPGKRDDQAWRYRWHDGRWWYWMPSERWVYWEDGRWMDAGRPAARRLGALRERMRGINLEDLMQSDGNGGIRIGEPRRGNVELELEGLPPVNFGF